jgi:carboxymethylenebutenolidase
MPAIESHLVQFPSDGRSVQGYLARPQNADAAPGLIVVQEWWGLVDHIKDVAERFATEGFCALAPDLYYGQQTEEPDDARKLAMDRPRAITDLEAAARYLRNQGCERVGAIGYCMGGGLVMELATREGVIDAAAPYYGRPLPKDRAHQVRVPMLGIYAELDAGIPVAHVNELSEALRRLDKDAVFHIYPDADHAFFNDTRPSSYHPEASADAWQKTLAFFRRTLGATAPAGA